MAAALDDWSFEAACRGSEGSLFFSPETSENKEVRLEREQHAKRLCSECSVRDACLETALAHRETYGIWGGLNEVERRVLLRG